MQAFEITQRALAQHLRDPANAPSLPGLEDRRVQIYRDLLFNNVEGLIANNFPVMKRLMSSEQWALLIRAYYREHPAHTPYFHQIAQEFMAFLAAQPALWQSQFPFLLELAHYEWLELALDIDTQSMAPSRPGDWMSQRISISPLARLAGYQYPVHRIRPDWQPTEPPAEPTWLMVYRNRQDKVQFQVLTPLAALLWATISEHRVTGSEAIAALNQKVPGLQLETATFIATLDGWLERDIVLGVEP